MGISFSNGYVITEPHKQLRHLYFCLLVKAPEIARRRAKVEDVHGARMGSWAWDVFLVAGP